MQFIDTHCHIQSAGLHEGERSTREVWSKAPDLTIDQLVNNAQSAGVTKMISVGCDLADSRLAINLAQQNEAVWASIGLHPHEAAISLQDDVLNDFGALATESRVVAVGECGLDYFYEHSPRLEQIKILRFQLDLAVEHNLPVIFHVREAFNDFWPIFDDYNGNIRGVLHSFTDSEANVEAAVKRGLYIGVNGIATFAKQPAQRTMYKSIPLQSLLLETDAPFLTPVPFRGKINEPKQIATVAAFIAELRGEPLEMIAQTTTANAKALFAL